MGLQIGEIVSRKEVQFSELKGKVIAVDAYNEQPVGVWYSKRPWGIGGDIVFDPRRTLSYLDLQTGVNSQYLGAEANPSAVSCPATYRSGTIPPRRNWNSPPPE